MDQPQRPPVHRFTRFIRVPTPGVRARFDEIEGEVVDVSASGALVRTNDELPIGSRWHVLLDLGAPVDVVVEISRCDGATRERSGTAPSHRFLLGVKFIDPSRLAMQAIIGWCGGAQTVEEWPYRILLLGDVPEENDVVRDLLGDAGYQVTVVSDPAAAMHSAHETHADAILVSASLTLAVLAMDRSRRRVPIVTVARPDALTPQQRRLLDERHVPVLSVPFTEGDLLTAAKLALRQK